MMQIKMSKELAGSNIPVLKNLAGQTFQVSKVKVKKNGKNGNGLVSFSIGISEYKDIPERLVSFL